MLCDTCFRMLRGQDGRIWKGTYDLNFNHHTQMKDLNRSADMHCGICRILFEELQTKLGLSSIIPPPSTPPSQLQIVVRSLRTYWVVVQIVKILSALRLLGLLQSLVSATIEPKPEANVTKDTRTVATTDNVPISITASLRVGPQKPANDTQPSGELYYLGFKLRCGHIRCRRTFALQRTGTVTVVTILQ
jgi:hypothetical protein